MHRTCYRPSQSEQLLAQSCRTEWKTWMQMVWNVQVSSPDSYVHLCSIFSTIMSLKSVLQSSRVQLHWPHDYDLSVFIMLDHTLLSCWSSTCSLLLCLFVKSTIQALTFEVDSHCLFRDLLTFVATKSATCGSNNQLPVSVSLVK